MSLALNTQIIAAANCDPVKSCTPLASACCPTVDAHFPDTSKQSKHATIVHKTLSQGAQNDYITKNATRAKSVQLNAFACETSRSPLGNLGNNQESTPTLGENDANSRPLPLAAEDHIVTVPKQLAGNHGAYPLPESDTMVLSPHRPESPASNRYGYVSILLQNFAERPLPTRLGVQIHDLQEWMWDILSQVSEPQSEEAKNILKEKPSAVLFAQQLHLVQDCGEHIEVMAQRAVDRDYYYDHLMRVYGDSTARRWITGREEGHSQRRRSSQRASLSMRKRVLIGEGYKVYHALMQMQMEQMSVCA